MADRNRPVITCEIAFSTAGALTVPSSWTDVSAYLRTDELSVRRGRADELQATQAGGLVCVLRNPDRRFEPEYASGVYFPNVVPLRRIRISATWDSVTYRLFTGLIMSYTPDYDAATGDEVVIVRAVDLLGYLTRVRNTGSVYNLYTGNSMIASLNAAGVSGSDRDITGITGSIITVYDDGLEISVTEVIQRAARVEWAPVWCAGDGRITFRSRHERYNPGTPGVLIGASGQPSYARVRLLYTGDQYLYTTVRVTRATSSGITATATNAASEAAYGALELGLSLALNLDADAEGMAWYILNLYDEARLRVQEIELIGETDPAALWPIILDADLQDRVRITHTPRAGGAAIVQDVAIEQIALTIRGNTWRAVWTLSPSDTADLGGWILDTSVLDTNTTLAF